LYLTIPTGRSAQFYLEKVPTFFCIKPNRFIHFSYIFLKTTTSIHPAEEGVCPVKLTSLVFDQKGDWDIICLFKTVSYQSGVAWLGAGEDPRKCTSASGYSLLRKIGRRLLFFKDNGPAFHGREGRIHGNRR
jgi:hypothetical protein